VEKGLIEVDPLTRTTLPASPSPGAFTSPRSGSKRRAAVAVGGAAALSGPEGEPLVEEGPMLQIESEHPYRHNTNEYTTVCVPGAVSYCVRFDPRTRTEPIYDYVKYVKMYKTHIMYMAPTY
jgi:hypothetical protein